MSGRKRGQERAELRMRDISDESGRSRTGFRREADRHSGDEAEQFSVTSGRAFTFAVIIRAGGSASLFTSREVPFGGSADKAPGC